MSINLGTYVAQADAQLSKLDSETTARLIRILQAQYDRLERELRKLYNSASAELSKESRTFREARARLLMEQLETLLDVLNEDSVGTTVSQHIRAVSSSEEQAALELLSAFGPATLARVPVEVISAASTNIAKNLAHHGEKFALETEEIVINGLVNGEGFGKMAARLRERSGVVRSRALMIVRTETMQASDTARRASYQQNGVEYVMRIATQDQRVCGHCLARAGSVFRVEEAPQSLHPNDRCYNAPFRPDWLRLGLIDVDWVKQHKADARERSPNRALSTPAPFEKAAGSEPPKAIWTPEGGYTEYYNPS